jgi:hypothetical protein
VLRSIKKFYQRTCVYGTLFAALAGAFGLFAISIGIEETVSPLYVVHPSVMCVALPVGFCTVFVYVAVNRTAMHRILMLKLLSGMLLSLTLIYLII